MKKILIATNILLLGIILFYACNPRSDVRNPNKPDIVIADNCLPRSLSVPLESGDGAIDAFLAQSMSRNYANDPYKGFIYNSGGLETTTDVNLLNVNRPQDTRSIWFDLRKLKSMVSSIENSVCDNNCKIPLKLGIRIYFAKYDPVVGPNSPKEDLRDLRPNYGNRHTVFFVATYDGAKGEHIDFDPMNVENKCTPTPFKRLLLLNPNGPYKVNSLGKQNIGIAADSSVDNHGDLMPPPDGVGTFPTGGN